MASPEELKKELHEGVVEYEEDRVVNAANAAVEEGVNAYDMVMNGLQRAWRRWAISMTNRSTSCPSF